MFRKGEIIFIRIIALLNTMNINHFVTTEGILMKTNYLSSIWTGGRCLLGPFMPHHIIDGVKAQIGGETDKYIPYQEVIV